MINQNEQNQDFEAAVEGFHGPLHVMLSLIQKEKLDLFSLDLSRLADQYIAWILRQKNLDDASQYMVEFARLLEYKSRKLLPKHEEEEGESAEEIESDYRNRLQLLAAFQVATGFLKEQEAQRKLQMERPVDSMVRIWQNQTETVMEKESVQRLSRTWEKLLRRWKPPEVAAQPFREIDIALMQEELEAFIKERGEISLDEIMDQAGSLLEAIGLFLALLELIHRQIVFLKNDIMKFNDKTGR